MIGLLNDDHTQYALLAGRTPGQVLRGGPLSTDALTLTGPGAVYLAPGSSDRLLIGTTSVSPANAKVTIKDAGRTIVAVDTWLAVANGTSLDLGISSQMMHLDSALNSASFLDNRVNLTTTGMVMNTGSSILSNVFQNNVAQGHLSLISSNDSYTLGTRTGGILLGSTSGHVWIQGTQGMSTRTDSTGLVVGIPIGTTNSGIVIGVSPGASEQVDCSIGSAGQYVSLGWNNTNSFGSLRTSAGANVALQYQSGDGNVGIGTTVPLSKLHVLGNVQVSGNLIHGTTATLTLPSQTDTLVGRATNDTLSNKVLLDGTNVRFANAADPSKFVSFDISGSSASTTTTLQTLSTSNRTLILPDINDTLVTKTSVDTLTNKKLSDANVIFISGSDSSKELAISLSSATASTRTTLQSSSTANRILILPDIDDTLVTKNLGCTLTNKSIISANLYGNVGINTPVGATFALHVNGDSLFDSNVTIGGNLVVNGTHTTLSTSDVEITDNFLNLASNNSNDIIDIGWFGTYVSTGVSKYSGMFRDSVATNKPFRFFKDLVSLPSSTIGTTMWTRADVAVGDVNTYTMTAGSGDLIVWANHLLVGVSSGGGVPLATLAVSGTLAVSNQLLTMVSSGAYNGSVGILQAAPVAELDVGGRARIIPGVTTTLTGTITIANVGLTVTGSGTKFIQELIPGDTIGVAGQSRVVTNIVSNTLATIASAFTQNLSAQVVTRVPVHLTIGASGALVVGGGVTGYLGLGTWSPDYPLTVATPSTGWSTNVVNGQANILLGLTSGEGLHINSGSLSSSSFALQAVNNAGTLLRVQTNGLVGIGTGSPGELLDVQGSGLPGDSVRAGNATMGIWTGSTTSMSVVHSNVKSTSTAYALRQHQSGDVYLNSASTKRIFVCNADTPLGAWTTTGLGIGTTNPSNALHVLGSGYMSGNLTLDGSLFVNGSQTTLNTTSIDVDVSLLHLASGNTTNNFDIGFFGDYQVGATLQSTGLYRNRANGVYTFFDNLGSGTPIGATQIPVGATCASIQAGAITALGPLVTNAQIQYHVATVSSGPVTLGDLDNIVLANAISGAIQVNLPAGGTTQVGKSWTVMKTDSTANIVTISCNGADTFDDGRISIILTQKFDRVRCMCLGGDVDTPSIKIFALM